MSSLLDERKLAFVAQYTYILGRKIRRVTLYTFNLLHRLLNAQEWNEVTIIQFLLIHDPAYHFIKDDKLLEEITEWVDKQDIKELANLINNYVKEEFKHELQASNNAAQGITTQVNDTPYIAQIITYFITKTSLKIDDIVNLPIAQVHILERTLVLQEIGSSEFYKRFKNNTKDSIVEWLKEQNKAVLTNTHN